MKLSLWSRHQTGDAKRKGGSFFRRIGRSKIMVSMAVLALGSYAIAGVPVTANGAVGDKYNVPVLSIDNALKVNAKEAWTLPVKDGDVVTYREMDELVQTEGHGFRAFSEICWYGTNLYRSNSVPEPVDFNSTPCLPLESFHVDGNSIQLTPIAKYRTEGNADTAAASGVDLTYSLKQGETAQQAISKYLYLKFGGSDGNLARFTFYFSKTSQKDVTPASVNRDGANPDIQVATDDPGVSVVSEDDNFKVVTKLVYRSDNNSDFSTELPIGCQRWCALLTSGYNNDARLKPGTSPVLQNVGDVDASWSNGKANADGSTGTGLREHFYRGDPRFVEGTDTSTVDRTQQRFKFSASSSVDIRVDGFNRQYQVAVVAGESDPGGATANRSNSGNYPGYVRKIFTGNPYKGLWADGNLSESDSKGVATGNCVMNSQNMPKDQRYDCGLDRWTDETAVVESGNYLATNDDYNFNADFMADGQYMGESQYTNPKNRQRQTFWHKWDRQDNCVLKWGCGEFRNLPVLDNKWRHAVSGAGGGCSTGSPDCPNPQTAPAFHYWGNDGNREVKLWFDRHAAGYQYNWQYLSEYGGTGGGQTIMRGLEINGESIVVDPVSFCPESQTEKDFKGNYGIGNVCFHAARRYAEKHYNFWQPAGSMRGVLRNGQLDEIRWLNYIQPFRNGIIKYYQDDNHKLVKDFQFTKGPNAGLVVSVKLINVRAGTEYKGMIDDFSSDMDYLGYCQKDSSVSADHNMDDEPCGTGTTHTSAFKRSNWDWTTRYEVTLKGPQASLTRVKASYLPNTQIWLMGDHENFQGSVGADTGIQNEIASVSVQSTDGKWTKLCVGGQKETSSRPETAGCSWAKSDTVSTAGNKYSVRFHMAPGYWAGTSQDGSLLSARAIERSVEEASRPALDIKASSSGWDPHYNLYDPGNPQTKWHEEAQDASLQNGFLQARLSLYNRPNVKVYDAEYAKAGLEYGTNYGSYIRTNAVPRNFWVQKMQYTADGASIENMDVAKNPNISDLNVKSSRVFDVPAPSGNLNQDFTNWKLVWCDKTECRPDDVVKSNSGVDYSRLLPGARVDISDITDLTSPVNDFNYNSSHDHFALISTSSSDLRGNSSDVMRYPLAKVFEGENAGDAWSETQAYFWGVPGLTASILPVEASRWAQLSQNEVREGKEYIYMAPTTVSGQQGSVFSQVLQESTLIGRRAPLYFFYSRPGVVFHWIAEDQTGKRLIDSDVNVNFFNGHGVKGQQARLCGATGNCRDLPAPSTQFGWGFLSQFDYEQSITSLGSMSNLQNEPIWAFFKAKSTSKTCKEDPIKYEYAPGPVGSGNAFSPLSIFQDRAINQDVGGGKIQLGGGRSDYTVKFVFNCRTTPALTYTLKRVPIPNDLWPEWGEAMNSVPVALKGANGVVIEPSSITWKGGSSSQPDERIFTWKTLDDIAQYQLFASVPSNNPDLRIINQTCKKADGTAVVLDQDKKYQLGGPTDDDSVNCEAQVVRSNLAFSSMVKSPIDFATADIASDKVRVKVEVLDESGQVRLASSKPYCPTSIDGLASSEYCAYFNGLKLDMNGNTTQGPGSLAFYANNDVPPVGEWEYSRIAPNTPVKFTLWDSQTNARWAGVGGHLYKLQKLKSGLNYLDSGVLNDSKNWVDMAVLDSEGSAIIAANEIAAGETSVFRWNFEQAPTFKLPLTGGHPSDLFIILGVLLATVAGTAMEIHRRRKAHLEAAIV